MGLIPLRKTRTSPVVEQLEDRRLLSHVGPAPGWDSPAFGASDHAELAPPTFGSMSATGPNDYGSAPGSPDRDAPSTTFKAFFDTARPGDLPTDQPWRGSDGIKESTAAFPVWATIPVSPMTNPYAASAESLGAVDPVAARAPVGDSPPTVGATILPTPEVPVRAATTTGPILHSGVSFVPTTRVETGSSSRIEAEASSEAGGSSLATVGVPQGGPEIAPGGSPRGSSTTSPAIGPRSPSSPPQPALDLGVAKGVPEVRSPDQTPRTPIDEVEGAGGLAGAEGLAGGRPEEGSDRPDPQLADMIMSLMPFDRSTLDGIVDRFLDPLEGFSSPISGSNAYLGLLASSLTLAVAVLAVDVSLRMRRTREDEGVGGLVDFPGLPGLGKGWMR